MLVSRTTDILLDSRPPWLGIPKLKAHDLFTEEAPVSYTEEAAMANILQGGQHVVWVQATPTHSKAQGCLLGS
jgi:hypothetical protein